MKKYLLLVDPREEVLILQETALSCFYGGEVLSLKDSSSVADLLRENGSPENRFVLNFVKNGLQSRRECSSVCDSHPRSNITHTWSCESSISPSCAFRWIYPLILFLDFFKVSIHHPFLYVSFGLYRSPSYMGYI